MAGDVVLNSKLNVSKYKNLQKSLAINDFDNEANISKKQAYLKLLRIIILVLSCILAFILRLFSVLRYEVVIHEFDPYFNYMATKYLTENGFYSFLNWFDSRAWYPLGRIIGGTIYPGLMLTSSFIYKILQRFNITLSILQVCVFIGPLFSCFTTILTYHLTSEISGDVRSALLASAFISIVPGYISRSVAGSYDNEAVAIFCMLLTFYCWLKSINSGRVVWSILCSLSYFYMASSWGGYVFIINLIPLHVFVLILMGRFKSSVYISYSLFYLFGTLLTMQIPFVGFQSITTGEHFAALSTFVLCQLLFCMNSLASRMPKRSFEILFRSLIVYFISFTTGIFFLLIFLGKISPFTGRLYSLLDPSYAKNYLPIIASVSEHQPTAWSWFYFDLQLLLFLFPVGIYVCFQRFTDTNIFLILYGLSSLYFTGIMVRLMLVLAPAMCILSAIGFSRLLSFSCQQYKYANLAKNHHYDKRSERSRHQQQRDSTKNSAKHERAKFFVILSTCLLISYSVHSIWVTSEAYSSPSIILKARTRDGTRLIFDDFREAYHWLRMNTHDDSKILSWWDYGYQISAMANRTTIVDNNTWNNTHISIVGQVFASGEREAYTIVRHLDVDYILVLFGGFIGYSSDDINKFLWMIRIASSAESGKNINEKDYLSKKSEFRVDKEAPQKLTNSLLYRLSYYQFGYVFNDNREHVPGFDRVRNSEIGLKNFKLQYFEEAYTTERWLVRIYRVKKPNNRFRTQN